MKQFVLCSFFFSSILLDLISFYQLFAHFFVPKSRMWLFGVAPNCERDVFYLVLYRAENYFQSKLMRIVKMKLTLTMLLHEKGQKDLLHRDQLAFKHASVSICQQGR